MRVVSERQLAVVPGSLAGTPRIVAGGNYATPWRALAVLDGSVGEELRQAGRDLGLRV